MVANLGLLGRQVGPFRGPKWVRALWGGQTRWKRRPWMRYTTRIRFVAGFWVFRGAKMGAKRWSRVPMEAVYLADPLAARIWGFVGGQEVGASWAFLRGEVGPFRGSKWVCSVFVGVHG